MNDTFKWVLLTLLAAIAVFAGGDALGVDWIMVQVSILAFLEKIGLLMLIFTGSAAAVELAKFYRSKNKELEKEHAAALAPLLTESELNALLERAVRDALAQADSDSEPRLNADDLVPDMDAAVREIRRQAPRSRDT